MADAVWYGSLFMKMHRMTGAAPIATDMGSCL